MPLSIEERDFDKFILIGDRVLIKPKEVNNKTRSGLYLPPGLEKQESLSSGYVIKVGPGHPLPALVDVEEPWKKGKDEVQYVPIQPSEGDLAVFLQNSAFDIEFNKEKYVIVPQSAILMLIRDEGLLE